MLSFINKLRQQFLKNSLRPYVIIGIIYAILLLSGKDINLTDAFFYVVMYLIGKNSIYYFESKKINWKQSIKDVSIFIFLTYLYHIIYLILVSVGLKPIKFLSKGIGYTITILVVISFIYVSFVVPVEILKQKKSTNKN
ncbi:hypothetical protein [Gottfriedia luciferensis]|uniref:hypothetical protein n=1 Tax=Gottfriedia luciferensis TaxID=178774 RepID=UPI000B43340A|nr:hypothetical protein [Gottfriedia luciferensis]